eukprot:scaffold130528_cov29-Tisochrysis_lutea.AAC.2
MVRMLLPLTIQEFSEKGDRLLFLEGRCTSFPLARMGTNMCDRRVGKKQDFGSFFEIWAHFPSVYFVRNFAKFGPQ